MSEQFNGGVANTNKPDMPGASNVDVKQPAEDGEKTHADVTGLGKVPDLSKDNRGKAGF